MPYLPAYMGEFWYGIAELAFWVIAAVMLGYLLRRLVNEGVYIVVDIFMRLPMMLVDQFISSMQQMFYKFGEERAKRKRSKEETDTVEEETVHMTESPAESKPSKGFAQYNVSMSVKDIVNEVPKQPKVAKPQVKHEADLSQPAYLRKGLFVSGAFGNKEIVENTFAKQPLPETVTNQSKRDQLRKQRAEFVKNKSSDKNPAKFQSQSGSRRKAMRNSTYSSNGTVSHA
ncbi:hypothetical protein HUO09_16835 [Vibrio sp. Y2-5]|uniref:hypothetical protein n=1 Tax=Vibrio sp. Y2-5 TaxID=2743977 RepID=UPI0016617D58|nr:hypothetical protein [Vibrio sp. Y2-5]MBD0788021.1 hypothetical protein [Vibrio sp. Y2-5]